MREPSMILLGELETIEPSLAEILTGLLDNKIVILGEMPASGLYLLADEQGLSLAKVGIKGKVRVDFVTGAARHRRLFGGGELLAKAVQAKNQPLIWDATGGLGRDAFVLASLGLKIVVFERHPIVHALLADGLNRAQICTQTNDITGNIKLIAGSITALPANIDIPLPEVIYLDPMYPSRQKSSAVKKEMAYFHELVGSDAMEEADLLLAARTKAHKRIVVKRPQQGTFLAGIKPAFQYQGKTTRFDGYLPLGSS